ISLSTGVLKSAVMQKTIDGRDYKVVFRKVAGGDAAGVDEQASAADVEAEPRLVINDYSKSKNQLELRAEQLVAQFHKTFHNVDVHYPQSKEIDRALTLIAQHGLE